jgi:hypothetical protein
MELNSICPPGAVFRPSAVDSGRLVFTRLPSVPGATLDETDEVITAELKKLRCSKCNQIYVNKALKFCRIDGGPLSTFNES